MNDNSTNERRNFIKLAALGSGLAALNEMRLDALAITDSSLFNSVMPQGTRLPLQSTQLLIKDLNRADPKDPSSLIKLRNISPAQLEAEFDKLDEVFTFDRATGQLSRNPQIKLTNEEETTVRKMLEGYQNSVKAKRVTLQRGSNNLFVPLSEQAEIERTGQSPVIIKPPKRGLQFNNFIPGSPSYFGSPSMLTKSESSNSGSTAFFCWKWWLMTRWWGFRLSLSKNLVDWIAGEGSSAVAGILAAVGLPAWLAPIVKGLAWVLKQISNENGVRIYYYAWLVPYATSKPTPSGGC